MKLDLHLRYPDKRLNTVIRIVGIHRRIFRHCNLQHFDRIDHSALMDRVRLRVKDKRVLGLVKAFLKAGLRKWKDFRRVFTDPNGRWRPLSAGGIELFNIGAVPVTRYRQRGNHIPTPWTEPTPA